MNQHDFDLNGGVGGGLGSLIDGLNWDHVRSEVAGESRARVGITGLVGAGKSTLLNSLHGWEVSPVGAGPGTGAAQEDLGLFVLLDLPAEGPATVEAWNGLDEEGAGPAVWETLEQADVILFLFDGALHLADDGLTEEQAAWRQQARLGEYRWYCRIKALGRPLVIALNKADRWPDAQAPTAGPDQRSAEPGLCAAVEGRGGRGATGGAGPVPGLFPHHRIRTAVAGAGCDGGIPADPGGWHGAGAGQPQAAYAGRLQQDGPPGAAGGAVWRRGDAAAEGV